MHSLIECVEILYGYISSVHHPLAITLNICLQSQLINVDKTYGASSSGSWDKVSSNYKYCNFLGSSELPVPFNINLPIDANQCKNIECNNITHFKGNDIFYNKLLSHS